MKPSTTTGPKPLRSAMVPARDAARVQRILGQELAYVYDRSFDEPGAEATILAPLPDGAAEVVPKPAPAAGRPALPGGYGAAPLLGREQEAHLFRKMNYLKYRAAKLRATLDPARPAAADLDAIERLLAEAGVIKDRVVCANLRLVVSLARRRVGPARNLFELVSDGNLTLLRAVEKFDVGRGFRFSTYASWAILRDFARTIPREAIRRSRFRTGRGEMFADVGDHRGDAIEAEGDRQRLQAAVLGLLGRLGDRERRILVHRYGLDGAGELTLKQLGQELEITKERVRQIESRAHDKLRRFAREELDDVSCRARLRSATEGRLR